MTSLHTPTGEGWARLPTLVEVPPSGPLLGTIRAPGDKSISHRALLLAAVAEGTTTIQGIADGDDVKRTARAIELLGVRSRRDRLANDGLSGCPEPR